MKTKQVGEMSNSEFKTHVRGIIECRSGEWRNVYLREEYRKAGAKLDDLQARMEELFAIRREIVQALNGAKAELKCPKCGTVGEHYCPAEVARE